MSGKSIKLNKKVIIIGCLIEAILIAFILYSVFYESPTYSSYIEKGQEQLNNEQYEEAIKTFDKALDVNSKGLDAYLGQSDGYIGLKQYDQAIETLEVAAKKISDNPKVYDKLINTCVQAKDIDKANEVVLSVFDAGISANEIDSIKPAPIITPEDKSFEEAITVTIENANDGTIYYTINGEIPTKNDTEYKKPFEIDIDGEYQIMAVKIQENGLIGFPATKEYKIKIDENSYKIDGINYEKYLGSWSDGETTLSINGIEKGVASFNIKLSWVDEVIKTSSSGKIEKGILHFSYTDNWGNTGTGTIRFGEKTIGLSMSESNSKSSVNPGFGNYTAVLNK